MITIMRPLSMMAKYYVYESGQSSAPIPKSIAQALGWKHLTQLRVEIKSIEGNVGVFLSKSKEQAATPEIALRGIINVESPEQRGLKTAFNWETFVKQMAIANTGNKYAGLVPFYALFQSPAEMHARMPTLLRWEDERRVDLQIANDPDVVRQREFLYQHGNRNLYYVLIREEQPEVLEEEESLKFPKESPSDPDIANPEEWTPVVALDWEAFVERMKLAIENSKHDDDIVPFSEVFASPEELRLTIPNLLAWEEERKIKLIVSDGKEEIHPEFLYPMERGQLFYVKIRKSWWQKVKESLESEEGEEKEEESEEEEEEEE